MAGVNKGAVLIRKTPPILNMLTYAPNEKKREKYKEIQKERERETDEQRKGTRKIKRQDVDA